jgi:hypothetical protein
MICAFSLLRVEVDWMAAGRRAHARRATFAPPAVRLAGVQLAVALVPLVGAALMVRSFSMAP